MMTIENFREVSFLFFDLLLDGVKLPNSDSAIFRANGYKVLTNSGEVSSSDCGNKFLGNY